MDPHSIIGERSCAGRGDTSFYLMFANLFKVAIARFLGTAFMVLNARRPAATHISSPESASYKLPAKNIVLSNSPNVPPTDKPTETTMGDQESDESEAPRSYCPEEDFTTGHPGYIPLDFGEVISAEEGTFKIVRKLGLGTTSSVWLAQRLEPTAGPYVAIKVMTAAWTSRFLTETPCEIAALHAVSRASDFYRGKRYCLHQLDSLIAESQHGLHLCIVMEPYSLSLECIVADPICRVLLSQVRPVRQAVQGLLMALELFHSLDFVHTDIKVDNLLFPVYDKQEAIEKFINGHPPRSHPSHSAPTGWPTPILAPLSQPLPPFAFSEKGFEFHLCDFGNAIPVKKITPGMCAMPTSLRAPEIILEHPWAQPLISGLLAVW
ncbi:hypothetical protein HGRIS_006229 [Hohenbuehelia grisea]|uniref:Protein kinase domain-containing protein n=1 Tax=Hohenbuehelia grisea TaxID=104357 RepID=A0ABR3K0J4_9AGAR